MTSQWFAKKNDLGVIISKKNKSEVSKWVGTSMKLNIFQNVKYFLGKLFTSYSL